MSRSSNIRAANMANRAVSLAAQLGFVLSSLPLVHTHLISPFAPSHPRDSLLQKAACGQFVNPAERFSADPSCPNCRLAIAQDEASR